MFFGGVVDKTLRIGLASHVLRLLHAALLLGNSFLLCPAMAKGIPQSAKLRSLLSRACVGNFVEFRKVIVTLCRVMRIYGDWRV
jgi:hypothetical protein